MRTLGRPSRRKSRLSPAGFDAGGKVALASRSSQKLHFSTTPLHRVWKVWVDLRDERPRVAVIHASRPVRARGHTEPAPDAAVIIHHHDAVRPLECGFCRADPHAWRVVAVVAEDRKRSFFQSGMRVGIGIGRENFFLWLRPDPPYFIFCVSEIRHIVYAMAGRDAVGAVGPAISVSTTMPQRFALRAEAG